MGLAERIAADLQANGPSRRHQIAKRLGVQSSSLYYTMLRRNDLFRQVGPRDQRWCLAEHRVVSRVETDVPGVSSTTLKASEEFPGANYDDYEAHLLRIVARWKTANKVKFVGPVETYRILVGMGWIKPEPPIAQNEGA